MMGQYKHCAWRVRAEGRNTMKKAVDWHDWHGPQKISLLLGGIVLPLDPEAGREGTC